MKRFDDEWGLRQQAKADKEGASVDDFSADLVAKARVIYRARRKRDRKFAAAGLFEDPAWDILLSLIIDEADGRATSVSSACISACVAATTALRWIDKMLRLGLMYREPDPFDGRRHYVRLTPDARRRMARALASI